jgi:hypothetical protein
LPHSVAVQHNRAEAELYPNCSFTLKPTHPTPVKQAEKKGDKQMPVEMESKEDHEYSSSEDDGEVFIRGAFLKRKRKGPKEYLPNHRKSVTNPFFGKRG